MDVAKFQAQMQKSVDYLETELKGLQVGKASPALVENITVQASYGEIKIPQIAHVSVMDAQTLRIEPWDKGEIKHIEKAIYDAEIGLTPQNQGEYILIKIPSLTEERRKEIAKQIKATGEDTKAQLRRIRQDAHKTTKQLLDEKEISEDENKNNEIEIDNIVKDMNTKIDAITTAKSEDVMKI